MDKKMNREEVLRRLLLIREMEHRIERFFQEGKLRGTTHCCIGQEAVPVALSYLIDIEKDYLCSGHRAHGLSMMMTLKPELLLGEIMGKPWGMAKGLGGSQHVYYKHYFTNGITGGMVPVAAGIAFALKQQSSQDIAVVDFGDGAMNEGYVLEAFNLAAGMKLPLLFILENNGYAMSTPVETVNPYRQFEDRVKGFGLPYSQVSTADFDTLFSTLEEAVLYVREKRTPMFVEVATHRFCGHSKSDKREYIPSEEDQWWKEHDCISNVAGKLPVATVSQIRESVQKEIDTICEYCLNN